MLPKNYNRISTGRIQSSDYKSDNWSLPVINKTRYISVKLFVARTSINIVGTLQLHVLKLLDLKFPFKIFKTLWTQSQKLTLSCLKTGHGANFNSSHRVNICESNSQTIEMFVIFLWPGMDISPSIPPFSTCNFKRDDNAWWIVHVADNKHVKFQDIIRSSTSCARLLHVHSKLNEIWTLSRLLLLARNTIVEDNLLCPAWLYRNIWRFNE